MQGDERYMRRCIDLAKLGRGQVSPNPMVGSVIVHDEQILGEGYHPEYGAPHAEVNALKEARNGLLSEATLYVNLEPCTHHGKTPPCTDRIIEAGIPEVVIGTRDPFPDVNGKGVEALEAAGVRVRTNVLGDQCRILNRRFLTFHEKERPYIILKWARTLDGFMDIPRNKGEKGVAWITNDETRKLVHQWRATEDAVMVGAQTAQTDNPALTVREVKGKNPLRLVLDKEGTLSSGLQIFDGTAGTLVFTEKAEEIGQEEIGQEEIGQKEIGQKEHVRSIGLSEDRSAIEQVGEVLYAEGIQSVLVEGGRQTLQSFINAGLWDEARILTGERSFGDGMKAPGVPGHIVERSTIGSDTLHVMIPTRNEDKAILS